MRDKIFMSLALMSYSTLAMRSQAMKIALIWDDSLPHVIHYRFEAGWTWEEFRETALAEHKLGEGLGGIRYDIIGDLTHATIPHGTGFTNVLRLFDQGPPNRKTIVVVGSTLAQSMIGVASKIYPRVQNRFFATRTIEQARLHIAMLRSKNP
jgi:hypothetical protein